MKDKLLDLVNKVQSSKEESNKGSIVGGVVAAALMIIVIAVLAFRAWRQGKKMAKAMHERDVLVEEKYLNKRKAEQVKLEKERQEALESIGKLSSDIKSVDNKIDNLNKKRERTKEAIKKVKSWEDVDRVVSL